MAELKIKRCVVGMISTNCYIVYKAPQGEENPCIIIDQEIMPHIWRNYAGMRS